MSNVIHFSSKNEQTAIRAAERIVLECREHLHQPRPRMDREHLLNVLSLTLVVLLESLGDYDQHREHPGAVIARMLATLVADLEDAPLVAEVSS